MSLESLLRAAPGPATYAASIVDSLGFAIPDSAEFRRVDALPRRVLGEPAPTVELFRRRLCLDSQCVFYGPLFPVQYSALNEAAEHRGLFGPIGVGAGKALISLLLPTVWGCTRPLLLVPHSLVTQTRRIYDHLKLHWKLVTPSIVSYWTLSRPESATLLLDLKPDCIVADEAHALAGAGGAGPRRSRFRDFFRQYPNTPFAALSGTMADKKLTDYASLAGLALHAGAPVPLNYKDRAAWGLALDDLGKFGNCPPGVLAKWQAAGESPREGYRRRVVETPGVVATSKTECDASLTIQALAPAVPDDVAAHLEELRRTWSRPDGEYFDSPLEFYRYGLQLSLGFYLRWKTKAPEEWLAARRAWNKEVCDFLRYRAKPGLDSPGLYEQSVRFGSTQSSNYTLWTRVKDTFKPRTECVWLSDFAMGYVTGWGAAEPGIVWTASPDFARRLARATGWAYYGRGPKAAAEILDVTGKETIIASIDAHGTGRNLQMYDRALVTECPSSGKAWEQVLGRLHRSGQKSDSVSYYVLQHTKETRNAFDSAQRNTRYQSETFTQPPRLLRASLLLLDF